MFSKPGLIIKSDPAALALAAADIFVSAAGECTARHGRFTVAVSGGSTPRQMHRVLAQEPFSSGMDWPNTHVFWVDERCVPYGSPASNYGAASEDLFQKISVATGRIYPMPTDLPPEGGAATYDAQLRSFFRSSQGAFPAFDLIFLGIGPDGHTASLFPGQPTLEERDRWVIAVRGGNPDVPRLTMTLPVLNHARRVVFLVAGREKAAVVKTVLDNDGTGLPAERVRPVEGILTWLVDQDAASLLPKETLHDAP